MPNFQILPKHKSSNAKYTFILLGFTQEMMELMKTPLRSINYQFQEKLHEML